MLKGDGGYEVQRVWILHPLLVKAFSVYFSTYLSLQETPAKGHRYGTGHSATKEFNWCGTSLVHMVNAIK